MSAAATSGVATAIATSGPSVVAPANKSVVTFVSSDYGVSKLHEIEMLFVDSLRPFAVKNVTFPPVDAKNAGDLKSAAISDCKFAFGEVKGACFVERRMIAADKKSHFFLGDSEINALHDKPGELQVCVSYTADGTTFQTWQCAVAGAFDARRNKSAAKSAADTKPKSYAEWSECWVVSGYPHALSLSAIDLHLGLTTAPYLDLADALRQHQFSGVMEIHIFVTPLNPSEADIARFKSDCAEQKIKCCHLRLDYVKAGFTAVLESSRYVNGPLSTVFRESFIDARYFASKGWNVIRTKIEATASIKGVPLTDDEARLLPPYTYFEFHMVVTKPDGKTPPSESEMKSVGVMAQSLERDWGVCIPLSTNSQATNKFLNMRCYGVGRNTAVPLLDKLAEAIKPHGFVSPRQIREFGVYDSNVSVDCGWLEPEVLPPSHLPGFIPPIRAGIEAAAAAAATATVSVHA